MLNKTFKFRLYPTKLQKEKIDLILKKCCDIYNYFLDQKIKSFNYLTESFNFSNFQNINIITKLRKERPEFNSIFSQTITDIIKRVNKSFQEYLQRIKKEKIDYPRFKLLNEYKTFFYSQWGFIVNGNQLFVSPVGKIKFKKHREIEGEIKTLLISKKNDKYFADFNCKFEKKLNLTANNNKEIGIDLGITHFIATSDGELIDNPKYLERSEAKLKLLRENVSRKNLDSNRRKKAELILTKNYEKVTNQRKDFLHKISKNLVNNNNSISIEDLNIKSMMKLNISNSHLNRKVIDASWNKFSTMLEYKAEESFKSIVKVDPKNTSQACSNCQEISENKLDLKARIFRCDFCNYFENRDVNAAKNILLKSKQQMI